MSAVDSSPAFDVVAIGEVLVEVATESAFGHGVPAMLGISGDALNVAASAAAAGARVGLLAVLTDDELGRAIADRVRALGISPDLLRFRRGQQGVYLVHSDPAGEREFSYARSGSVGSTLSVGDVDDDVLRSAGAVVASGIACAISESSRALVLHAAEVSGRFVYDPNHRPRLIDAADAAADLRRIAASAALVTPSFPGETTALLDAATAAEAAHALLALGAGAVAVTCGSKGVHVESADESFWVDAVPAPLVVDQTGAGDAFVGTLTARIVLGDSLAEATALAAAAASLVVGGRGGTGLVPTLEQTRTHAGARA